LTVSPVSPLLFMPGHLRLGGGPFCVAVTLVEPFSGTLLGSGTSRSFRPCSCRLLGHPGADLRLKIEELAQERSRLEEDKKLLEAQLERLTLQGDFDQSRTKVLHLSLNPASVARQRFREDWQQLQEECKHLRELVRALEAGGPVPADLEAAAGLPSSKEVAELKRQVESAELKNQRLKEVFQTKIQEFRKACYALTGYQVDITTEGQFRLTSMYAERKADCLVFKAAGPSGTKMQLLETEFSRTVPELIELHLLRQDSIPAFLSALTLDLFSRQTVA
uniref:Mitotic spindle assembly checkpoint protein MAD1 n=1 Tax=Sus scrofa TaxID=9823 RepID=A0A8D1GUT0_PIG